MLIAALFELSTATYGQNITLKVKDASLLEIFKQLHQQTAVEFIYDNKVLKESKPVSLHVVNQPLIEVLDLCFVHQPLDFEFIANTIIIKRKTKTSQPASPAAKKPVAMTVSGRVV
ncbi:MAG: hypothetical protein EOO01_17650, partial [Chitinophagaceae bacterium]